MRKWQKWVLIVNTEHKILLDLLLAVQFERLNNLSLA